MSENTASANAAAAELSRLALPGPIRLSQIVDGFDEIESYFSSSEGVVIRVLRSKDASENSRPAYLQFYDTAGRLLKNYVKHHEASALFFNRFSAKLNHSLVYRLNAKPSFIESPNIKNFWDLVPVSPWKTITNLGLPN